MTALKRQFALLGLWLVAGTGCHYSVLGKRSQEVCCPTDIRKTYCLPWGEDAVFQTPCYPDPAYHGYKPTCWRDWQAPAEVWRDERCGPPMEGLPLFLGEPSAAATEEVQPPFMPPEPPGAGPTQELPPQPKSLPPVEEEFQPTQLPPPPLGLQQSFQYGNPTPAPVGLVAPTSADLPLSDVPDDVGAETASEADGEPGPEPARPSETVLGDIRFAFELRDVGPAAPEEPR